jgi:hypothetical protein
VIIGPEAHRAPKAARPVMTSRMAIPWTMPAERNSSSRAARFQVSSSTMVWGTWQQHYMALAEEAERKLAPVAAEAHQRLLLVLHHLDRSSGS